MNTKLNRLSIWFCSKTRELNSDVLVLAGIALFIFVFVNGCIPNFMPLAASTDSNLTPEQQLEANKRVELNKIIFNSLIAINTTLVTVYIVAVNTKIRQRNTQLRVSSIPQAEWDYLSLVVAKDALNKLPNTFNGLSKEISDERSNNESRFIDDLERRRLEYIDRQEALIGLSKGLADENDTDGLITTMCVASNFALGKNCSLQDQDLFYKCMYTYRTAWLVCSITYNLNIDNKNSLPIDSIFYQNPTKKKLYIKAISDLIDRFNSNPAKKFFKTEESVQVIQKYLNELVYLIGQKTEKIQQDHVGNKQNLNIS